LFPGKNINNRTTDFFNYKTMKLLLSFAFLLCIKSAFSQDMIYLTDGTKIPGKISEIASDKINFKNLANPTGPVYSRSISGVSLAFNAAGNYIVFAQANPLTDKEKQDFITETPKPRSYDILIDPQGKVLSVNVTDETEAEIATNTHGQQVKYNKTNLVFLIRKNGKHQLFSSPEFALPLLTADKDKIAEALAQPNPDAATGPATAKDGDYIEPDMALFSVKALAKTNEFTGYLTAVQSINTDRDAATKSINQACDLFLEGGINARVEVSTTASTDVKKYLVRDYLNRLMIKSGQFDKVNIETANINYASKFTKGADGNYYGTVTFIQKFSGFKDGNLVLAEETKKSITIVLKHYVKEVNGESVSGWEIFLDDMGVVENRKV
jgi:hypothetical protein